MHVRLLLREEGEVVREGARRNRDARREPKARYLTYSTENNIEVYVEEDEAEGTPLCQPDPLHYVARVAIRALGEESTPE